MEREVAPLVGGTDLIIFAFGEDLDSWQGYATDRRSLYLKQGFDYYCNVDASSEHWIQIGANGLFPSGKTKSGRNSYVGGSYELY